MMAIEYCTNEEWLVDGIARDAGVEEWVEDICFAYIDAAIRYTEDRSVVVVPAKGQRCTFHGWNGAHFAGRNGIFGWWGNIGSAARAVLDEANAVGFDAAIAAAKSFAAV